MKWLLKRWLKQLWEVAMEVLDEWIEQKELKKPTLSSTNQPRQQYQPKTRASVVKQQAHDILKGRR